MTKRNAMRWIRALRSGKYKQGKKNLQNRYGYCCLGVACDIFIPNNKLQLEHGLLCGIVPNDQINCPDWLKNIESSFKSYNLLSEEHSVYLANLNDDLDCSFDEIADIIQAVYVERVLG